MTKVLLTLFLITFLVHMQVFLRTERDLSLLLLYDLTMRTFDTSYCNSVYIGLFLIAIQLLHVSKKNLTPSENDT